MGVCALDCDILLCLVLTEADDLRPAGATHANIECDASRWGKWQGAGKIEDAGQMRGMS
jgi:hypothetical protein